MGGGDLIHSRRIQLLVLTVLTLVLLAGLVCGRTYGAGTTVEKIMISRGGVYTFSGSLTRTQIYVAASDEDTVTICLSGVTITNSEGAAIYIENAKETILLLKEGTENIVQSGTKTETEMSEADNEEQTGAAIYARDDLTITGNGSLQVLGYKNNGIHTTNDLVIESGEIQVEASNIGIKGKDSVRITGGTISILSGGDGIRSNDTTGTGYGVITITDGNFEINSGGDGIQAETVLEISGGTFAVTTGGGSENAEQESSDRMPGMPEKGGGHREEQRPFEGGQRDFRKESPVPDQAPDFAPNSVSGQAPDFASDTDQDEELEAADSSKGFKSGTEMRISGGVFTVDSCDDGFHSDGTLTISEGTFYIESGDDGIHAETELGISGGEILIAACYEGVEANQIWIEAGELDITSSDDGINANGGTTEWGFASLNGEELPNLSILGGTISINAGGDGLDSNGNILVEGGAVIVDGPSDSGNGAIDSGSESGGTCIVNGGTVLALGSSGMAESFDENSGQCSFRYDLDFTFETGSEITVMDENGNMIYSYTAVKSGNSIVFSSPELVLGETYVLTVAGQQMELALDSISTSAGNSRRGGFGW